MKKIIKPIDICQESNYVLPKSIQGLDDGDLQAYYQYYFANGSDSPLSLRIDSILSDTEKDILFTQMLVAINATSSDFIFNSILRNKINDIRLLGLSDTTLTADRIKGFFHIKNSNQHKLDSMLKRIRDSFAHGRIAFDGTYLILEDKANELTGRLIITIEALRIWKSVIIQMIQKKGVII